MSTRLFRNLLCGAFIALTVAIVHPIYADVPSYCTPNGAYNAFADVTGDGKADAIVINSYGVIVRRSNWPNAFGPNETWIGNAYYGNRGTYFVDINGIDADGKVRADAIAVNDWGITVLRSSGAVFSTTLTTTNAFYGNVGTYFADVTGDGRADAIAVNTSGVTVRRFNQAGFNTALEPWTTNPYYGNIGTYFADVTGDGRADAIVDNYSNVTVRPSVKPLFAPDIFGANESWTTNPYYGNIGTYFADVTGDGRADAIVVNSSSVTVRRAVGDLITPYEFKANELWSSTPTAAYGNIGTYFADVTGDGKDDEIQVNRFSGVTLSQSNGSRFLAPATILPPYYSDLSPLCLN
jgi:hypothetical protein